MNSFKKNLNKLLFIIHFQWRSWGAITFQMFVHFLNAYNYNATQLSCTDLHQSKFLLAGVVVSGGTFILLSTVWAFFVGVFISGVHQLPGILQKGKQKQFYMKDCNMMIILKEMQEKSKSLFFKATSQIWETMVHHLHPQPNLLHIY